jgi:hypothetical protein
MSKDTGYETAVNLSIEKLRNIDLNTRCLTIGIPAPRNGVLLFRAFGRDMTLRLEDFQLFPVNSEKPVKVSDRILVLHYLECSFPIHQTNRLITFRQMDSGIFYWEAFLSRSVRPLVERIGNDLETLRKNLDRFDWEHVSMEKGMGDLVARIHAIGNIYVTLVYHSGDEEFPPEAELFFDSSIKQVFPTEDVAVLAGRICLNLV